jgi:hypothetical protein
MRYGLFLVALHIITMVGLVVALLKRADLL